MFIGEDPIHIASGADIAPLVLMPGDPLRAKYIAENFLEDATLVTNIRNMSGYTGTYQGKKVTVMASGMGMPSASIYVFELIHFFHVKKIIRIGTCGAVNPKCEIGSLVLTKDIYSESNFAHTYSDYQEHIVHASDKLNMTVLTTAKELGKEVIFGTTTTMDVFGPYIDFERVLNRIPKDLEILTEEMEAFGLTHVANLYNVDATTLMTVVDSKYSKVVLSPQDRETKLDSMITLALSAITK